MRNNLCMNRFNIQLAIIYLSLCGFAPATPTGRESGTKPGCSLENANLTFDPTGAGQFRLTNKLTGKSHVGKDASFEILIETDGKTIRVGGADFSRRSLSQPAPGSLKICYAQSKDLKGLRVEAEFTLEPDAWFIKKRLHLTNGTGMPLVLPEVNVDKFRIEGVAWPSKLENPMFLDDQLFWGLEWPIATLVIRDGSVLLGHTPGISVAPGESWTSKTSGFGVALTGGVKEAFCRYLQQILVCRTSFATFYFDWLCHDNSGPLESEILANFAALRKLKDLHGLQFDIYNSDAGLVESQNTYFPEYRPIFDRRFPKGLKTVAEKSAALNMSLGLWVGPDGFGESAADMKQRRDQLVSWVRDFNVGLYKLDSVVSPIAHKDRIILEKKYQSLADALTEARRINPSLVVINHRVNESPYMLTMTDCLLWKGQETYVDVHINNTSDSLYNRDCSINRDLTTEFFNVPFRQFEDHGICFNSCLEKWDNDLVSQAFGRASVLSPEMYGTFFFLSDDDYPKLARLIQLHKQSAPMLKRAFPLPDGDIAHSDGQSAMIVLRNPTWETKVTTITLDESIGLKALRGAPLTVRQRHPHELLIAGDGTGFKDGDTLQIQLDPYELRLIQVDTGAPDDFFLGGIDYDVIPGPDPKTFKLKLLGEPGRDHQVTFHNSQDSRFDLDGQTFTPPPGTASWQVPFAGKSQPLNRPLFSVMGDCTEIKLDPAQGNLLSELARFSIDDEALEAKVLAELREHPSKFPEIEACRDYMQAKIVEAEGTCRNAFDGIPSTRWGDGYPKSNRFTNTHPPYKNDTSLWRIDFGQAVPLAKLELYVVRRTDKAFLESAEISNDLKTWTRVDGLSLKATDKIPFLKEIKRKQGSMNLYDVDAGDGAPVVVTINFPENQSRYLRLKGRNFTVAEIVGYDRDGKPLDRSNWRATNYYGEPATPTRVLRLSNPLVDYWPGQEIAVAVRSGKQKLNPVDGALVLIAVDGKMQVPQHRVPSYPYHAYEGCNGPSLIKRGLDGMTFRMPTRKEWAGHNIEVTVLLAGEGTEDATARVRIVTPNKPAIPKILSVSPK